ncbi:MAG: BrnT family toxin [Woeseiaceae bacterium]
MRLRFEWDEAKRRSNLRKHGIDFAGCEELFEGCTLTIEDNRFDYGEQRFVTFGLLNERVVTVAHTETVRTIHITSIRKATRNEQKIFFKNFSN